jgi:hypothetical protein
VSASGKLYERGGLKAIVIEKIEAQKSAGLLKTGSAQEFVETRISGCFLKNDEFCFCDRHALRFEQQIAEILVVPVCGPAQTTKARRSPSY